MRIEYAMQIQSYAFPGLVFQLSGGVAVRLPNLAELLRAVPGHSEPNAPSCAEPFPSQPSRTVPHRSEAFRSVPRREEGGGRGRERARGSGRFGTVRFGSGRFRTVQDGSERLERQSGKVPSSSGTSAQHSTAQPTAVDSASACLILLSKPRRRAPKALHTLPSSQKQRLH